MPRSRNQLDIADPTTITLSDMKECSKVNVEAKAIDVCPGSGKRKQEVIIADATSTATLTLWENAIDLLAL